VSRALRRRHRHHRAGAGRLVLRGRSVRVPERGPDTRPGAGTSTRSTPIPLHPRNNDWRSLFPWCWPTRRHVACALPHAGQTYEEPGWCFFRGRRVGCGMASTAVARSTARQTARSTLTSASTATSEQVWRAGGFRPGLRHRHEVGHHVQTCWELPTRSIRLAPGERDRGQQAFCLDGAAGGLLCRPLGLPRHKARKILEQGDVEEALNAAALSAMTDAAEVPGYVTPDSFTHGSSAQRTHWFKVGLQRQCRAVQTRSRQPASSA